MIVQGPTPRNWLVTVVGGLALAAAGSVATWLVMRSSGGDQPIPPRPPAAATSGDSHGPGAHAAHDAPWPDVLVPLSRDAVERAGIGLAPVEAGRAAASLRLPV